jgi:hypothetical protein
MARCTRKKPRLRSVRKGTPSDTAAWPVSDHACLGSRQAPFIALGASPSFCGVGYPSSHRPPSTAGVAPTMCHRPLALERSVLSRRARPPSHSMSSQRARRARTGCSAARARLDSSGAGRVTFDGGDGRRSGVRVGCERRERPRARVVYPLLGVDLMDRPVIAGNRWEGVRRAGRGGSSCMRFGIAHHGRTARHLACQ